MGFIAGVIVGIAGALAGAAFYMSRSGQSLREQYHLEDRLGEVGDRAVQATKELQQTANTQIAEMRSGGTSTNDIAGSAADAVDSAIGGAESAAGDAADSITKSVKKATT